MTEKDLNDFNVYSVFEKVGCVEMAEGVWVDPAYACFSCGVFDVFSRLFFCDFS